MLQTHRLSPMTTYYLRKFIETRQEQLRWTQANLKIPIMLDHSLEQLRRHSREVNDSLNLLEQLVSVHQSLVSIYPAHSSQVLDIEERIYELLGLQLVDRCKVTNLTAFASDELPPSTYQDLVIQLNKLRKHCLSLLGDQLTDAYLLESRPNKTWCQLFTISEIGPINFCGNLMELISEEHFRDFQAWINAFKEKILLIMPYLEQDNIVEMDQSLF